MTPAYLQFFERRPESHGCRCRLCGACTGLSDDATRNHLKKRHPAAYATSTRGRSKLLATRDAIDEARLNVSESPLYGLGRRDAEAFANGVFWSVSH